MSKQPQQPPYAEHAEILRPEIERIHRASKRLMTFNLVAMSLPAIALFGSILSRNALSIPTSVLLTSVISAAAVQAARWQKAKLKDGFEKMWANAAHETRNLTLGMLDEAMHDKIGQTKNILGRDDFNVKDRHVAIQLGTTIVVTAVMPSLGPVMYFTGTQTRELGDAARIESAARGTLDFYDYIRSPMMP